MKAFLFAVLLIVGMAGVAIVSNTSMAQQAQCGPMEQIEKYLAEEHGEYTAMNLHANDFVYVLTVNPETKSWSIVGLRADGVGCFLAAGEGVSAGVPYTPSSEPL